MKNGAQKQELPFVHIFTFFTVLKCFFVSRIFFQVHFQNAYFTFFQVHFQKVFFHIFFAFFHMFHMFCEKYEKSVEKMRFEHVLRKKV